MSFLPTRAGIGDNDTPDQNEELQSRVEDQRGEDDGFSIPPEDSMAEHRPESEDEYETSDVYQSSLAENDSRQWLRSQEENEEDRLDNGQESAAIERPAAGVSSPAESIETPDNPPSIQVLGLGSSNVDKHVLICLSIRWRPLQEVAREVSVLQYYGRVLIHLCDLSIGGSRHV